MKLNIINSHSSHNFYCTINQIIVSGKTYLSYTTEKTTSRMAEEIKKTYNDTLIGTESIQDEFLVGEETMESGLKIFFEDEELEKV